MLFLTTARISKLLRGEAMDEELFRNYFIKLYRKIVSMEAKLLSVLDDEDKDGFVLFSRSMRDLSMLFKVYKDPSSTVQVASLKPQSALQDSKEDVAVRVILGLGDLPDAGRKKFAILPYGYDGIYKVCLAERVDNNQEVT